VGSQLKDALKAKGFGTSKQNGRAGGAPLNHASNGNQPLLRFPASWSEKAPASAKDSTQRSVGTTTGRGVTGFVEHGRLNALGAAPVPVLTLIKTHEFQPHAFFQVDMDESLDLPAISHEGIDRQITGQPDNETDLIIGLDFGTSATKVVIRDRLASHGVFPVRLNSRRQGIQAYLIPSRIFRTGETYSLTQGVDRISNLKLALLACKSPIVETEFNDCCAFLALVIRRARAWLLTEHQDIYRGHALNWRLNLGLAARSYEDREMVMLFRRLAWAAANLAADPAAKEVTLKQVDRYRLDSLNASDRVLDQKVEFSWDDVDAVPEVTAQLHGFMSSARWDWHSRPVMMLVDVGAGTVDSALFHVNAQKGGSGVLTFYSSRVELNGAMNLHRARVAWLQNLLPIGAEHRVPAEYLAAIATPTDRLRPIPESVHEYLPGYEIAPIGKDIDEEFRIGKYRTQVAGGIIDAYNGNDVPISQLKKVPLLLCGGGSRMKLYRSIDKDLNTPGWPVNVEAMRLPIPQDLVDTGLHTDDFDRLSVAYGLSLAGDGKTSIGKIVRAIDVPKLPPVEHNDYGNKFVSKDMT
jgi:hypothetical protein